MDPRYSRYPPPGRRSPTPLNPARVSLPTTVGYSPMYDTDIRVLPSGRYDNYETIVSPRGLPDYRQPPPPAQNRYSVTKEPLSRSSSLRETGRDRRSSTLDHGHQRPIIVMTEKHGHHHAAGSHASHSSAVQQPGSPTRDPYRSSDEGQYYAQPASSIRPRHHHRNSFTGQTMSATLDDDDFLRLRDRQDSLLASATRAEPFGRSRPQSIYSSAPRQGISSVDYGEDGYEYTNPSDLARYDLDNDRPPRRRRESFDGRNYYRPSVSVSTEVETLPSRSRDYDHGRRGGPPPTTWGLDKVNRSAAAGIYDPPQIRMPLPPVVPSGPTDPGRRQSYLETPGSPTERRGSRQRPASVYHEVQPHAHHHDDFYRGRDDELVERELRGHPHEFFIEDDVSQRGFGIRVDPEPRGEHHREPEARAPDDRRERRQPRRDADDREHWESSDEDDVRPADRAADRVPDRRDPEHRSRRVRDREDDGRERRARDEARPERRAEDDAHHKPSRRDDDARDHKSVKDADDRHSDDDERERKSVRDKVATGLGIAVASIGLGSALKKDEKADKEDGGSPKRRKAPEEARRSSNEIDPEVRGTADRYEPKARQTDDRKPSVRDDDRKPSTRDDDRKPSIRDAPELIEPPKDRRQREERSDAGTSDLETRPVEKRATDAVAKGEPSEPQTPPSDEDKATPRTRRKRAAGAAAAFDPRDTAGLMEIKAKLAALDDKGKPATDEAAPREAAAPPTIREPSPERRSPSSPRKRDSAEETALVIVDKDGRGRELAPPAHDARQVRLVSPPREEERKKPLRGILKAPRTQFPEEDNPVREGVAPHKDDKTKQNVPNGARWTKIARKLVNPEALTIGKERFEVRDDFVIVLRVLNKDEIEAYTAATAQLRGGLQPFSLLRFALFCP